MLNKSQNKGTQTCKVEKRYIVEKDTVMWAVNAWTVLVVDISRVVSVFFISTGCGVVAIHSREEFDWKSRV